MGGGLMQLVAYGAQDVYLNCWVEKHAAEESDI
jgi:hypothetical protein